MAQKLKPQAESLYGLPQPLQSNLIPDIIAKRAPTSGDTGYSIGQIWIDKVGLRGYELLGVSAGVATWGFSSSPNAPVEFLTADSGGAIGPDANFNITLAGTANEITTTGSGHTITVSLPAAIITPGSLTTTTTLTGGTGVTATTGNITATTGNIVSSAGSVSAATTVTGGTGLIATTGDLTVSAGNALVTGNVVAAKSAAGSNVTVQATNSDNTNGASNGGVEIATGGASSGDPYLSFQISGVGASTMTMGLDNSAADLFVISNSASIGTANALTLTQAGALTATTSITATLGNITATNGNLVLNTAGNKIVSTSVGSGTAAGANSFGTVTLAGGTATVDTTSVTASSIIMLTRQSVGATGAAALGHLSVGTIVAGTSFVINAWSAADATSLQASDVSIIGWMIIN